MNTGVTKPSVVTTGLWQICCLLSILSFSACGKQEPGFEKRGYNGNKEFTIKVTGLDYFSCIINTNEGTKYENDIEEEVLPTSFAEEEEAMAKEEEFIAADALIG